VGANPAPAGGTLELRLVLEARHMPVDAVAQVGKGLAQGRLDLEPSSCAAITLEGSCSRSLTWICVLPFVCEATTSSRTNSERNRLRWFSSCRPSSAITSGALLAMLVQIAQCGSYLHFRHFL
jgi:hypothetical protein